MTREEKIALDKAHLSLIHDGEQHQVAKTGCPVLPKRLNNGL